MTHITLYVKMNKLSNRYDLNIKIKHAKLKDTEF